MMKALFFSTTVALTLTSWGLPKVNIPNAPADANVTCVAPAEADVTATTMAGKIIKAGELTTANTLTVLHGDSLMVTEAVFHRKGSVKVNTIVIDPGHGGHDPGCSGAHSREKHIALAIGKYFAEGLQKNFPDVKVIMTRSTDVFIPLHERAAIATREKADLFVSIHCNFIPKAGHVHGTETYVLGLHATEANLEVAKRENASILLEENYQETYGYDPNSPEAHIVFSMFQNAFLEQSILFAQKVQHHSTGEARRKDRGVKQAGFLVLRHATMPSVLVETGYLSNVDEENYLRTDKGQQAMANALLEAFAAYKNDMEGTDQSQPLVKVETKEKPAPTANSPENYTASTTPSDAAVVVPVKAESTPVIVQKDKSPTIDTPVVIKTEPAKTNTSPVVTGKIIPSSPVSETKPPTSQPQTQTADIQYRVQLAASPTLLDISQGKWTKVDYSIEVIQEGNLYKYQVRNFATLDEANNAKQKLRAIGFNDAFVAAYQNGQRIK